MSGNVATRLRNRFAKVLIVGTSGFSALLGGGRVPDEGKYARLEAHGFYWTSSESGQAREKEMATSVRCVRE